MQNILNLSEPSWSFSEEVNRFIVVTYLYWVIANLLACTKNISRITKSVAHCLRPVYKYAFIIKLGFLRQNWERIPLVNEDPRWENKVQRKYLSSVLYLTIYNRQHFYRNFRPFTRWKSVDFALKRAPLRVIGRCGLYDSFKIYW